jgi:hypothetical protein
MMAFEIRVLAIVFAIALQAQTTLSVGETEIRAASSDLFLPIALAYIAIGLLTSRLQLEWRTSGVIWWLIAITVSMTVALFTGYNNLGHVSSWAIVNRFGGWFALLAYFLIGTAFVRFGGVQLRDEFVRIFLITATVVSGLNVLAMPWLLKYDTLPFGTEFNHATGAMHNSNAFGFLMVVAAILKTASDQKFKFFLAPILAALWFSGSQGALLGVIVAMLTFFFISRRRLLTAILPTLTAVVAILLVTVITFAVNSNFLANVQSGNGPIGVVSSELLNVQEETIKNVFAQYAQALDLLASKPLFGHGLGFFVAKTESTLQISLLWLLLETGIVGAATILGFLGVMVCSLYSGREDPFLLGMFVVATTFAIISVTGDFLYQRHFWLLLGMAMAQPAPSPKAR